MAISRFVFFIFCFYSACYFAQNKTDSLGRKTGLWIFTEENNEAFGEFTITNCEFQAGQKNGRCIIKNRAEEVLAEINFINNKKEGQAIRYEKGKVQEIAVFTCDTLIIKETYSKGKLFKSEFYTAYKDTIVLSNIYFFHPNGKKWIWRKYENGNLKKEIYYKKNGTIKLSTDYDN